LDTNLVHVHPVELLGSREDGGGAAVAEQDALAGEYGRVRRVVRREDHVAGGTGHAYKYDNATIISVYLT
jgi:hypothetical protein